MAFDAFTSSGWTTGVLAEGDLGEYQAKVTEARDLLAEALAGLTGVPAGADAAPDGGADGTTTTTAPPDG